MYLLPKRSVWEEEGGHSNVYKEGRARDGLPPENRNNGSTLLKSTKSNIFEILEGDVGFNNNDMEYKSQPHEK